MSVEAKPSRRLRDIPVGVWILGFISLLVDVSSEMIHALLPIYLVTVLGTSALMVGVIGRFLAAVHRKAMMRKLVLVTALAGSAVLYVGVGFAQHTHHRHHAATSGGDTRQSVRFPDELREHMLAYMRDHLLALQEIQEASARKQEDKAARIAEERLGMTSLQLHGAHEVAKYMPQGMQDVGSEMQRSASRFASEAQNAAVSLDAALALGNQLKQLEAALVGNCFGDGGELRKEGAFGVVT